MNLDELILVLTSMEAAQRVAEAIRNPALQGAHGWDLARWQCEAVPEAVRFIHHDIRGQPDSAVLCVQAPESCRWVYDATVRLAPYPTKVLMFAGSANRAEVDAATVPTAP